MTLFYWISFFMDKYYLKYINIVNGINSINPINPNSSELYTSESKLDEKEPTFNSELDYILFNEENGFSYKI